MISKNFLSGVEDKAGKQSAALPDLGRERQLRVVPFNMEKLIYCLTFTP